MQVGKWGFWITGQEPLPWKQVAATCLEKAEAWIRLAPITAAVIQIRRQQARDIFQTLPTARMYADSPSII